MPLACAEPALAVQILSTSTPKSKCLAYVPQQMSSCQAWFDFKRTFMPPPSMERIRTPRPRIGGRPIARRTSSFSPRMARALVAATPTHRCTPPTCRTHVHHFTGKHLMDSACSHLESETLFESYYDAGLACACVATVQARLHLQDKHNTASNNTSSLLQSHAVAQSHWFTTPFARGCMRSTPYQSPVLERGCQQSMLHIAPHTLSWARRANQSRRPGAASTTGRLSRQNAKFPSVSSAAVLTSSAPLRTSSWSACRFCMHHSCLLWPFLASTALPDKPHIVDMHASLPPHETISTTLWLKA